jgi:gliding motility-associated-like protein
MRYSRKMRILFWAFLLFSSATIHAQFADFEFDTESWRCSGDPVSIIPEWFPTGGIPGGYIKGTDSSQGGTCYFEAPAEFLGNKGDAYGGVIAYDMFNDDTTDQASYPSRPDIILEGGGLRLVYDNFFNPGLNWQHFEVSLDEFTGWRINALNGVLATRAQLCTVLSNLTRMAFRFEYRLTEEAAGLDNVELRSNFAFDLDENNSTASLKDYRADTVCVGRGPLADADVVLRSESRIDSITIQISNAKVQEIIVLNPIPNNIFFKKTGQGRYTLVNKGTAGSSDFIEAIRRLEYVDQSAKPLRATRRITYRVFLLCGEVASAIAYLPVFPPARAGLPGDTLVCEGSGLLDLALVLRGDPDGGGIWTPATSTGSSFFNPEKDLPGRYQYIIPKVGKCPGDSTYIDIRIQKGFKLPPDTTLCYGDALVLRIPIPLDDWAWSNGRQTSTLTVTDSGTYVLQGMIEGCRFEDDIHIDYYSCSKCQFYAPNVFSPNDDGLNDGWQLFIPCVWTTFDLQIFDRWGSLCYESNDGNKSWNGRVRERDASPGVYTWVARWTGELFGQPEPYQAQGSLTLIR